MTFLQVVSYKTFQKFARNLQTQTYVVRFLTNAWFVSILKGVNYTISRVKRGCEFALYIFTGTHILEVFLIPTWRNGVRIGIKLRKWRKRKVTLTNHLPWPGPWFTSGSLWRTTCEVGPLCLSQEETDLRGLHAQEMVELEIKPSSILYFPFLTQEQ